MVRSTPPTLTPAPHVSKPNSRSARMRERDSPTATQTD